MATRRHVLSGAALVLICAALPMWVYAETLHATDDTSISFSRPGKAYGATRYGQIASPGLFGFSGGSVAPDAIEEAFPEEFARPAVDAQGDADGPPVAGGGAWGE
ncbi:MAG TPA: hypothetical protein ENN80_02190, partial [Candidatus Hydrogenedentes bacterium]|nr:hypothetical protein [Candidatus Hydrogenedentota bacterium]